MIGIRDRTRGSASAWSNVNHTFATRLHFISDVDDQQELYWRHIAVPRAASYPPRMVLRGRKPFMYTTPPPNLPDNAEVFEMRGTGEVFTDYESYLRRYVYLR